MNGTHHLAEELNSENLREFDGNFKLGKSTQERLDTSTQPQDSQHSRALIRMITEEVVHSFGGADDSGDDDNLLDALEAELNACRKDDARKSKRNLNKATKKTKNNKATKKKKALPRALSAESTLEELYYSQIAERFLAESIKDKIATHHLGQDTQDSFAELDLDDLVEEKCRLSSRSLSRSIISECSGSGDGTRSGKESSSASDGLSAVLKQVMDAIPQSVRVQISEEEWGAIFGSQSKASSKSSESLGYELDETGPGPHRSGILIDGIALPSELDVGEGDDELSTCSEITGLTHAFSSSSIDDPRNAPSKRLSRAGTAISDLTSPTQASEDYSWDVTRAASAGERQAKRFSSTHNNKGLVDQSKPVSEASRVVPPTTSMTVSKPLSRRVSFNEVQVRIYECILSDNPGVQSGPSIGIGWQFKRADSHDIDDWERIRGPLRTTYELVLPRHVRERRLQDVGYSQKDIADMVRKISKAKNQRVQTVNNLKAQGTEEAIERAQRKVRSILSLGMTLSMVKKKKTQTGKNQ
jgi:hypothetical protein